MILVKNNTIAGADGKPILLDVLYKAESVKPVVIYAHGFNGFKDWAAFDLIAGQFVKAGFCFIKFNFSHGGTSPQKPEDFVDLEAYGTSNYTKELYDLQAVINWTLGKNNPHRNAIDPLRLYLVGHSCGGSMVLLKAAEETSIKAVVTWASVSQSKTPWGSWPQERIEKWKESGVDYYTNSRTKQLMPLYYQLYEDYQANRERLHIPLLLCHGTNNEAIPVSNAYQLKEAAQNAELFLLPSEHVFGRKHPWPENLLPYAMQAVLDKTIAFLQAVNGKEVFQQFVLAASHFMSLQ